jgi:hypothetical protein
MNWRRLSIIAGVGAFGLGFSTSWLERIDLTALAAWSAVVLATLTGVGKRTAP